MRVSIWLAAVLLAGAGGLWLRADARESSDLQKKVMSAVRVQGMAPPLAGVSARGGVRVTPLSPRRIGADTASADYHRYMNRCMACHEPPAPDLHEKAAWAAIVERMDANMRAAGTLGLRGEDGAAVVRFLQRHAR